MAKILITGASGQLGQCLMDAAPRFPTHRFAGYDIDRLDVSDSGAIRQIVRKEEATVLINCAAYTAVDKAEREHVQAWAVNAEAVEGLARACRQLRVLLVHISTDYVFDGTATIPYTEGDPPCPVSVYGASKLAGERFALSYERGVVVRTSWLYAPCGHNFVAAMLRLGAERETLPVVNDQIGSPTYAPHLATALLRMVAQIEAASCPEPLMGLYHFSNSGACSWFDFAQKIKEHAGCRARMVSIPSSEYPTLVKRPAYSVLDTTKITGTFGIVPPSWEEGLSDYFALKNHHSYNQNYGQL